jgi:hypothetical protein
VAHLDVINRQFRRRTQENLNTDTKYSCRDLNRAPTESMSETLPPDPTSSALLCRKLTILHQLFLAIIRRVHIEGI